MSALERMLEILFRLNAGRFDTLDNLASEFEVSNMTIRRDISILSRYFPIFTVQGRGGGIHMNDDAFFINRYMTAVQISLLDRLSVGLEVADMAIMDSIFRDFTVTSRVERR